jgi:hypothetical protein
MFGVPKYQQEKEMLDSYVHRFEQFEEEKNLIFVWGNKEWKLHVSVINAIYPYPHIAHHICAEMVDQNCEEYTSIKKKVGGNWVHDFVDDYEIVDETLENILTQLEYRTFTCIACEGYNHLMRFLGIELLNLQDNEEDITILEDSANSKIVIKTHIDNACLVQEILNKDWGTWLIITIT